MHGKLKIKSTEEQKKIQKLEKEKMTRHFNEILSKILSARHNGTKDVETLNLISECLLKAPEWNLFWNYRREILVELNYEEELMNKELHITKICLKENPKAYGIWHHRSWVMSNHPNPNWKTELELCCMALKEDERNFHCWDYRRFVVEKGEISHADEFEYTSNRITDNISNYSSWHYRCSFLDSKSMENNLKEELELINNAIFTDPHDQSPWFYMRWLMLYNKKKSFIRELYVNKALKEIILIVSEPVSNSFFDKTSIEVVNCAGDVNKIVIKSNENSSSIWQSALKNSLLSSVWILPIPDANFEEDISINLKFNGSCECKWSIDLPSQNFESLIRTDTDINRILCESVSEEMSLELVEEELKTIRELHSMQDDNKWVLLTIISMLRILSPIESKSEILDKLTQLKRIDSMRKQFYEDAASKFQIECELIRLYNNHQRDVILPSHNLTIVGHLDWMVLMTTINLSNNDISQIPAEFQYLVCLVNLDLSNNRITSLANLRGLPSLLNLNVQNNCISQFEQHTESVLYCPKLIKLNIKGNTVTQLHNLTELLLNHPSSKNHSSSISVIYDITV